MVKLARIGSYDFEIAETPGRACTRVSVCGDLDLASASPLRRRLRALEAEGTDVSVDLSQLEFIDSFGARVLIDAVARSHDGGSRVTVESNMPRQVRRVFDLLKAMEQPQGIIAVGHACIFCGDAVTEDQPLIVMEHDGERETSLACEPELRQHRSVLLVHGYCAENLRSRTPHRSGSERRSG